MKYKNFVLFLTLMIFGNVSAAEKWGPAGWGLEEELRVMREDQERLSGQGILSQGTSSGQTKVVIRGEEYFLVLQGGKQRLIDLKTMHSVIIERGTVPVEFGTRKIKHYEDGGKEGEDPLVKLSDCCRGAVCTLSKK